MNSDTKRDHLVARGIRHLAEDLRRKAGCLDEPTQADFALGRAWLHPLQWLHWRKCRLCRRDVDELRAILAECRPMVSHPMPRESGRDWIAGLGFAAAVGIAVIGIAGVVHMVSPRPTQKGNSVAAVPTPILGQDALPETDIGPSLPLERPKSEVTPVPSIPSAIADSQPPSTTDRTRDLQGSGKFPLGTAIPNGAAAFSTNTALRGGTVPVPLAEISITPRATPAPATPNPQTALAATPRPIVAQNVAPPPAIPESTPLFATSSIWQATADAGNSPDLKASVVVSVGGKRVGRATLRDAQPLLAAGRKPLDIAPKEFFNLVFDDVSRKADPVLCVVDFSVSDRFYVVGLTSNRKFSGDIQFGNGWTMGRFELVTLIPNKDGELLRTVGNNRKVSPKILDQLFVKAGRLFLISPNEKDDSGVEVRFAPGAGRTGIAVAVTRPPNGR